jgi:hypothetical protein
MLVVPIQIPGGQAGHTTLPFRQEDLKEQQSNQPLIRGICERDGKTLKSRALKWDGFERIS